MHHKLKIEAIGKGSELSGSISCVVNVIRLISIESDSVFSLSSGIGTFFIGQESSSIKGYTIGFVSTFLGCGVLVY